MVYDSNRGLSGLGCILKLRERFGGHMAKQASKQTNKQYTN